MKLNEEQQLELDKCVMNFIKFVDKTEESRTYNYASAFAFGAAAAMKSARLAMCACCKEWEKSKGCTVKKCPMEEAFIDATLAILKRKTRTMLLTTLNCD